MRVQCLARAGHFVSESTLCIEISFFQVQILPTTPALFSVGVGYFFVRGSGLIRISIASSVVLTANSLGSSGT
jgi:hypothetical protein